MSERDDEAPEEPMLFGIPLSMFPKVPAREEREPTLWELFKLGVCPPVPTWPFRWPAERNERRG